MENTERARAHGELTVVLDGRSCGAEALARSLRRLLATVPRDARVLALAARGVRLESSLARRARVISGGEDLLTTTVARAVAEDRAVVLLPARASVTGPAWWPAVQERFARAPRTTGVLGLTGEKVMAFPPGVVTVDGPQALWSGVPDLALPRPAVAPSPAAESTPSRKSLGAVLIVKDEERVLEACLLAVAPFVDEVVVYDTGSTDRTLEIARAHATVVVEGYWDDHFGDARNRALAHSTTDWVLSLDADEVAQGDVAGLRRLIDHDEADAVVVPIISTTWSDASTGDETRASRLFRRAGATWAGALHEQVTADGGRRALRLSGEEPPLRLIHSGYTAAAIAAKDKRSRNLEIARAALRAAPAGSSRHADLTVDYGRSLALSGQLDDSLAVLGGLLERPASSGNMLQAGRVAVPLLVQLGRWAELEAWFTALDAHGEAPGQLVLWRAGVLVGRGDVSGAAELVDALLARGDGGRDLWGKAFDLHTAIALRAELDLLQGRAHDAAERMLGLLQAVPETVNLQVLVNALGAVGATMQDLIVVAPPAFLERSLRHMVALPPAVALPWFSAYSAAHPGDYRPLVAGATAAARSTWLDALEWSVRAREAGLQGVCALRDLAEQADRSPVERALAWALLADGLGEPDAGERFLAALAEQDDEEAALCRELLGEHVPAALDRLDGVLVTAR